MGAVYTDRYSQTSIRAGRFGTHPESGSFDDRLLPTYPLANMFFTEVRW